MFFFHDTATTEIYTLSLHDALPIFRLSVLIPQHAHRSRAHGIDLRSMGGHGALPYGDGGGVAVVVSERTTPTPPRDRKSTRLNSSHANISYAVFCLKKKILQLHFDE